MAGGVWECSACWTGLGIGDGMVAGAQHAIADGVVAKQLFAGCLCEALGVKEHACDVYTMGNCGAWEWKGDVIG